MFRKYSKFYIFIFLICLIVFTNAHAQIGAGGKGDAIAVQLGGLVNSNVFKRLPNRPSQTKQKKVGKSVVKTKTVAKTKSTVTTKTSNKTSTKTKPSPIYETYSVLNFKPIQNSDFDRQLAISLTNKENEQDALIAIFKATKSAYEVEVAKTGRKNNVAMATALFIASCVTVYNNVPEPSEAAIDNLYESLAESMLQDDDFANSSDYDKQFLHDKLIYLSGFVLTGYLNSKQTNDADSLQVFRVLAGVCLTSLAKLDPDKLSFNETGLVVEP